MSKNKILIVDDEKAMRDALKTVLSEKYEIAVAENAREAIELFKANQFLLVITDLKLPDKDGIYVLKQVKRIDNNVKVIVMTAFGTIENAVLAMKLGAIDYIQKPFSFTELEDLVEKSLTFAEKPVYNPENKYLDDGIIGSSKKMQEIYELIEKVAKSDATVLILGESGTGKGLIAQAIHNHSNRAEYPFMVVNCAALTPTLLESELFGHVKGAFTGAFKDKIGKFEAANKGTVFLDEISEIEKELQVKLLRFIQEKKFEKVGDIKTLQADVRIIAATNKNLKALVDASKFREDLYFRLNVIPIHLPPLRERREDIPELAQHFLYIYAKKNRKKIKKISKELMQKLIEYDWPGNVRELENTIERLVVLSDDEVLKESKFFKLTESERDNKLDFRGTLAELEKFYIIKLLEENAWNISKVSKLLDIDRKTLYNKLEKYGIKRKDSITEKGG